TTNPNLSPVDRAKAQHMFAVTQQMLQKSAGGQQPPGAFPVEFSDSVLSEAMQKFPHFPPAPGQPPRGPLPPTNVVLLNEFGGEDQQHLDDEYYSEDEVDDNVDDHAAFTGYNNGSYQTAGDAPKKKSKKKKKKGSMPVSIPIQTPNPAPVPPPAARTQPPAAIPSSRAAGKQPMSYSATAPAPAPAPAPTAPPSRTHRTATKPSVPSHYHHSSAASSQTSKSAVNNKLWNTNSAEERERIKEFWLSLGEDERRNLVKIEKEAVLKKMKEQQKHSCSCAVCGRKRHAIEEELEVLYDAYYDELEQYANQQKRSVSSGGTIPPPPGPGPFPGSVELDKNGAFVGAPHHTRNAKSLPNHHPPHPGRKTAPVNGARKKQESEFDDEDGEEEEYEEEDYEEEDEEEEEEEEEEDIEEEETEDKPHPRGRAVAPPARGRQVAPNGTKAHSGEDFWGFGSNLAVTAGPGNILTVADDLLKNDGQKFLEMMEQLAERRMQREEEAANEVERDTGDEDEEDEGDEDEDEDEEDEEDEDEEDEDEPLTEEQKMEQGRRMFSIFAARMFEQRVLQAYREKVARERQMQLLRELEDEDKAAQERMAKKEKENQKKKAKRQLQKQQKEEEKRAQEAAIAAAEAERLAKQAAQEEERRKKLEDDRNRREALKKQQEEERLKKDEQKRALQQRQRELQQEQERKKKEKEEKQRREKEEKERKLKEERENRLAVDRARKEQQDKEAREKRAKEEEERKAKEAKEREATLARQNTKAAAAKLRAPTSPRNAVPSPSRSIPTQAQKTILQKAQSLPTPTPGPSTAPAPAPAPALQAAPRPPPPRPAINTQAPVTVAPQPQLPAMSAAHLHSPGPSTTPISVATFPNQQFPSPGGPMSATMSPRPGPPFVNGPMAPPGFMPPFGLPGGPGAPGLPPQALGPSALPRYPIGASGFDPMRASMVPPSKGLSNNPPGSPIGGSFNAAPGPSTIPLRRSSVAERGPLGSSFGTISRPIAPIAPIARPHAPKEEATDSPKSKSSDSPPNAEPVLGSSALQPDDDEPIMPQGRRVVAGSVGTWATGPGWPTNQGVPFGAPGRSPNGIPPNGLWGATPGSDPWQTGFTPHSPFAAGFPTHSPPPGAS
ncbi:hypothetical protein M422DRAFT_34884, partial [Sphaerobolus stellatus SS14]